VACRLHAVLCELIPGGVSKRITAGQAAQILTSITPQNAVEAARCEFAADFLEDLRGIDDAMRDTKHKLTAAVQAAGTTITEVFGVGPVIAATVIAGVGDISRFPSRDHFAAYNGTAPIEVSSGQRKIYRLSRRGNRRLNHVIHMAAVTQIRYRHSDGRAYYDRKLAEGKTPKRHCARSIAASATPSSPACRPTPAGPQQARTKEPGRATGERLCRQRGRLTPPGTGSSAKPLPDPLPPHDRRPQLGQEDPGLTAELPRTP
jgi:hypothetical protein